MKDYFSIGELSAYQHISKQTLIYYDKIDLFKPSYVDPNTGYRYYDAKQIDYLDTIIIMKKIGFSLKEIREYMQEYTIDTSIKVMRRQLKVIDEKLAELSMIRTRVQQRCENMELAKQVSNNEIVVTSKKSQFLLIKEVTSPFSFKEISIATKSCYTYAFTKTLPIYFECGVIVPRMKIKKGCYTEASYAFVLVDKCLNDKNIIEIPKGKIVYTYHIGTYETIGNSYDKLLKYCEDNNLTIISDAYEFCINDYISSNQEQEFITKIMFYIQN